MNVIVCYKLTPDPEDIEARGDGSISTERAEWVIGNFDLQAIEAGMRIAEASGGKVTALSAGPRQITNSKLKKDLLSRGPDELYLVVDDALAGADTAMTARVLAAAIQKLGGAEVVLFGEGSADLYFQQVGVQVGERLGMATFNAVNRIETQDGALLVERDLEDEVEALEIPLPAALSVTVDIQQPRLPTMKEILKASKKPVTEWTLADIGLENAGAPTVESGPARAPETRQRKGILIESGAEEAAQTLLGHLSKEGLV